MKKAILSLTILIFISCGSTKIKRSNFITLNINKTENKNETDTSSILINSVDFDYLKEINNRKEKSSFNIFIVSNNLYVEAKAENLDDKVIDINGTIKYNNKNESINFKIKYEKDIDTINLNKFSKNIYSFNIKDHIIQDSIITSKKTKESYINYTIFNSRNYIIQKDILELISGELTRDKKKSLKFLVINDPAEPDTYIKSLGLIESMFFSERDYNHYVKECAKQKKINCKKGYDLTFEYTFLSCKLKCNCK